VIYLRVPHLLLHFFSICRVATAVYCPACLAYRCETFSSEEKKQEKKQGGPVPDFFAVFLNTQSTDFAKRRSPYDNVENFRPRLLTWRGCPDRNADIPVGASVGWKTDVAVRTPAPRSKPFLF
jgi:hypothetical protein